MYFMYTRYLDLTAKHPVGVMPMDDFRLMMLQNKRDDLVKSKLLDSKIGYFPKSKKDFDQVRAKLEDISKVLTDNLVFCFVVKDDPKSEEKSCITLHKGVWKNFINMNAAVKELFHVPNNENIVDVMVVHYPDGKSPA